MAQQRSPGRFGRIPPETADLISDLVQTVNRDVLQVLPSGAGSKTRAATLEVILGIVLRDWHENANTSGLLTDDVKDLQSFVQLAANLAGGDLENTGAPIFRTVLTGLMEDWLANWNSPNDPGPPGPD